MSGGATAGIFEEAKRGYGQKIGAISPLTAPRTIQSSEGPVRRKLVEWYCSSKRGSLC